MTNPPIVVDTSALCAIILGEPDAERFVETLGGHRGDVLISTVSFVETTIVADSKRRSAGLAALATLLRELAVEQVPVDGVLAELAIVAWQRFGKGRRHPAQLNLGDCFSYALAKQIDAPLLFKGDDFSHTDLASVL